MGIRATMATLSPIGSPSEEFHTFKTEVLDALGAGEDEAVCMHPTHAISGKAGPPVQLGYRPRANVHDAACLFFFFSLSLLAGGIRRV